MTANPPTRMAQLRAASRAMLEGLSPKQQRCQSHPELSPMLWHVGHVFFIENYWLAERVFGDCTHTDPWRTLYCPEDCPKDVRGARLPDADQLLHWSRTVSAINDHYWRQAEEYPHPLLDKGYLHAFLRQHYAQHLETMRLAAAQLHSAREPARPCDLYPLAPRPTMIQLARHRVTLGTDSIEAYDNEQPTCAVGVDAFSIATHPVTNAEWLAFMTAGGYTRAELWDAPGWAWRKTERIVKPQRWQALANCQWHIPGHGDRPLAQQAVHGISWYEARAFARYAGARLPREVEWEAARRADALSGCHEVWEWCADAFHPYPGFRAFPYDGYSLPWFDGRHFIARGGSRHTEPEIRRPGFRNFYPPTHRHVCAGLRLAR